MPTYAYVAKDAQGKPFKGTTEAENEKILVKRLREQGYWVTSVTKQRAAAAEGAKKKKKMLFGGKVKLNHLSVFCRQFATMINAGVSLVRCLAILEQQTASPKLREIIRDIQTQVEGGMTLSKALSKYPLVFSNLFIGLVRAGEIGGVLDESLDRLATFLEKDMELRRKVKAAMTYPTLVMVAAFFIVTGLVTFILPKFMAIFKDFKVTMPASTQFLMNLSHFMTTKWYFMLIGLVLFRIAFGKYIRTKTGKRQWDWLKLKMPVFGGLNHKIAVARFSRTLGTLMTSGVPILQALETVAGAIDNDILSSAVLEARNAIREGARIGEPLERSGLFPPMVVHMITIGEETGALDQMLEKIAEFYESEVEAQLAGLAAALEPLMIVFLGGVVGFIVIAMFMPLIQIISSLSE